MSIDWKKLDAVIDGYKAEGQTGQLDKLNIWDCQLCGLPHICVDRDIGVTPFILRCRLTPGCKGMAESRFYRLPADNLLKPQFEWYRPKPGESFPNMNDAGMIQHIQKGGLMLREIDK